MLAQGFLNPIDAGRAELQNQIGNFLQGRTRLNRLMGIQDLQVQGQAQGLYAVQTALETRLQNEITPVLQKVSTGVYDTSDVLTLGGFTALLVKQINDVGNLERQAGISGSVASGFGFDLSTIAIGGIVLVGLGIMSGMFFGRGQSSSSS